MSAGIKVVKSAFIILCIQVIQRGLGIISTIILARLLAPEHFGIIALTVIAIQFFELLVETGTQQYIIQKDTVSKEDLNTAWTLDILTKSFICIVIIALASPISAFFNEPALIYPLAISALTLPIRAFKTPGLLKLAREINYRPVFKLTLYQKLISFLVVICLAFYNPDHWAIIIGNLVSSFIFAFGSYLIHDYRPRFTLQNVATQWNFSQWSILRGIVGFTRSQIDTLMVPKLFGTSQLGGYNVVRELSLLPALSIIVPISEPLLRALSQSRNSPEHLAFRTRLSIALPACGMIPVTFFMMGYPELIVGVILGEKWLEFSELLTAFGLIFFSFPLFALVCDAMIAQGKMRFLFFLDLASTTLIFFALLAFSTSDVYQLAWLRASLSVATLAFYLVLLDRQVKFSMFRLAWLLLPVTLSSAIGLFITYKFDLAFESYLLNLFINGLLFLAFTAPLVCGLTLLLLRKSEEYQQVRNILINLIRSRKETPAA